MEETTKSKKATSKVISAIGHFSFLRSPLRDRGGFGGLSSESSIQDAYKDSSIPV